MCARRFLLVIFVLTLLVVASAVAIFQFGQDVLIKTATPRGQFEAQAAGDGPDYAQAAAWLARPGGDEALAQWRPSNWPPPTLEPRRAAVFYIHPTTYLERDKWNAAIGEASAEERSRLFVQSQASAFNGLGDIWAPRYRQAAYGAFLLDSKDATAALDLAYGDVLRAFDAFAAATDKPIILAGHSQGSLHLLRLLADRSDGLAGRLVAAYVVGWPVSTTADLPATRLSACATATSTGCVLSWQSFAEPANPSLILDAWEDRPGRGGAHNRRDIVCTDPVTGTNGGASRPTANPGTLVPDGELSAATIEPSRVGARCEKGILLIDGDIPPMGPYVLPGNNYHVYDYALFWGAVRRDGERRLAAWRAR
jgi:hypothetical protein